MRAHAISNNLRSGTLEILWSDGSRQRFSHAYLRIQCQCTHCKSLKIRGETGDGTPAELRVTEIHPIGMYGIQLVFNDGHDRGIYPWPYLHLLTDEQGCL
jgi:DUF971 family protein